jgi:hypothetical protein
MGHDQLTQMEEAQLRASWQARLTLPVDDNPDELWQAIEALRSVFAT